MVVRGGTVIDFDASLQQGHSSTTVDKKELTNSNESTNANTSPTHTKLAERKK